uniref:Rab-GAP TBC domain-containing protein n=1 Tax=Picocystis salinarum TaxID=88271 RepID=A0A7S3UCF5_9CHLO
MHLHFHAPTPSTFHWSGPRTYPAGHPMPLWDGHVHAFGAFPIRTGASFGVDGCLVVLQRGVVSRGTAGCLDLVIPTDRWRIERCRKDVGGRRQAMAEEEEGLERIKAHVGRGAKAVGGAISMAGVALAKGATSAALLVTDGHARRSGFRGLARRTKRLRNTSTRDYTKRLAKIYQALEKAQDRLRKRRIEVLRDDGLEDEVDVQICDRLLEMAPRELRSRLWCYLASVSCAKEVGAVHTVSTYNHLSEQEQYTLAQLPRTVKAENHPESADVEPTHTALPCSARSALHGGGDVVKDWVDQGIKRDEESIWVGMSHIEWPPSPPHGTRYETLLQVTSGQEEIDEMIDRDIHRTFPEHRKFCSRDGQMALKNILKAYSLHDLEVGYCQGMAFPAGILLMYLPEEPAFRALTLALGEGGANLRQLYTPELSGLQLALKRLGKLIHRRHPQLGRHLEEHGVAPLLYASPWMLSLFSNTYPQSFSARILDVILTERSGNILMRTCLSILAHTEMHVLALDDFEEIVEYLKIEPGKWPDVELREVLSHAIRFELPQSEINEIDVELETEEQESRNRRASTPKISSPSTTEEASTSESPVLQTDGAVEMQDRDSEIAEMMLATLEQDLGWEIIDGDESSNESLSSSLQ